jgi:hypothetical protein
MWRGRLARLVLAVAVGVLAVMVFNSFRHEGSDGSAGSTTDGGSGDGESTVSVGARWDTKLDLLGDRTAECQVASSTQCGTLMEDVVLALSGLSNDISSAGTDTDYSDTQADIKRLEGNVSDYDAANCPLPMVPGAAAPSPGCQVDATQVTAGIFPLRAELDVDELKAGTQ